MINLTNYICFDYMQSNLIKLQFAIWDPPGPEPGGQRIVDLQYAICNLHYTPYIMHHALGIGIGINIGIYIKHRHRHRHKHRHRNHHNHNHHDPCLGSENPDLARPWLYVGPSQNSIIDYIYFFSIILSNVISII